MKALPLLPAIGEYEPIVAGQYDFSPVGRSTRLEIEKLDRTINSPYAQYAKAAKRLEKVQAGSVDHYTVTLPADFIIDGWQEFSGTTISSIDQLLTYAEVPAHNNVVDLLRKAETTAALRDRIADLRVGSKSWHITDPTIQKLLATIKYKGDKGGVGS